MKVLFIGGNGNISWWCVEEALKLGHEVFELNRKATRSTRRSVQKEVHEIVADYRNEKEVIYALQDMHFDVVCDFICFNAEQAERAIRLFNQKVQQYIVISSEAVYQRIRENIPFVESSTQYESDVDDSYIAGKILMERVFKNAYEVRNFPVTIVRPGYTYDTIIQFPIGQNCFTAPQFLLEGYPFLIPGDGNNLLAPLHSKDFARAFSYLIGNAHCIGEEYQIAAEENLTMNEMADAILDALFLKTRGKLYIPYAEAVKITDFYSEVVNYQHMNDYLFNVDKIRSIVPGWKQEISFKDGIKDTVNWLLGSKIRQRINPNFKNSLTRIYDIYLRRQCK